MSEPTLGNDSDNENLPQAEVRQTAGDGAVQASRDVNGPIATGDHATATYEDYSVHYHNLPVPPPGLSGRARLVKTYADRLRDVLSKKLSVAAGPLAVEWRTADSGRMSSPDQLITECLSRRRIILRGSAGAGKSMLIRRASLHSLGSGNALPVIFDLSQWKPAHTKALNEIGESPEARRQQLAVIGHTSVVPINPSVLDLLAEGDEVILIIDGLNEVASQKTSETIQSAIDAYLQERPLNLSALVTDRVHHDGSADLFPWVEFEMRPLSSQTIDEALSVHFPPEMICTVSSANRTLLGLPFFLEQVIATGNLAMGTAESSLEHFYMRQQQLAKGTFDSLSQMAFEMYRRSARSASKSFASKWLSSNTAERLVADGTLVEATNGEIQFDHQLKHDFFAASFLSKHHEEWNSTSFNQVTFSTNSIELLLSTLKILASAEIGDKFLQAVYDWHWLPAIKTVGASEDGTGTLFSKEVEVWLACCAAEKVLDPLIWTGEATKALLERLPNSTFRRAAAVQSPDDVVALSHSIESTEEWFLRWREIFSLGNDESTREEHLQSLGSDDPVMGWAFSNAVKRWALDEADLRQLRAIYRSAGDVGVRWRVVHALGAFVSRANAHLLFEALDNAEEEWVRYGAIRSLVELAILASEGERMRVLEELRLRLASLTSRLQLKLGEAIFVSNPPPLWGTVVAPLLQEAASMQQMQVDIDSWRILHRQFDRYERGLAIAPPSR
jgi:hypothetical protein